MSIAHIPGKLFLMGEYSVVRGDSPAMILPTQRTLTVSVVQSHRWIFESDLENSFASDHWDELVDWAFPELKKILHTLNDTLPLEPLKWTVKSELDDTLHAYGLGSSGAFTVAMIKATYQFYGKKLSSKELFRLSALTQNDPTSSYGDLAVQAFQTPIYFKRPKDLLNAFNEVIIEPMDMPFKYLVIHSGQKVKSAPFVEAFFDKIKTNTVINYIAKMNEVVTDFKDKPSLNLIQDASLAYVKMAQHVHPGIITSVLEDILEKISLAGGVGKISGAGGGDNVLAFYENEATYQALIKHLSSYSIL